MFKTKKDVNEANGSKITVGESIWMFIVIFSKFSVCLNIFLMRRSGSPVVRALCFHCQGPGFNPRSRN